MLFPYWDSYLPPPPPPTAILLPPSKVVVSLGSSLGDGTCGTPSTLLWGSQLHLKQLSHFGWCTSLIHEQPLPPLHSRSHMFTDFVHFTLPLLIFIPYHSSFPISSCPILAPLHHIQVVTLLNFLHQHPINLQHLYLSFHFSGCSSVGYITQ